MKNQFSLAAVIPAFNEAESLKQTVDEIRSRLRELTQDYTLVIVDDGSTDGTWNVISGLNAADPNLIGIRLSRNYGKDAAIICGLESVRADACLVIDADGQHPPEKIPEFVRLWREEGYQLVNGKKSRRRDTSIWRSLIARFFNRAFTLASRVDLNESSDFKLLSRQAVEALLLNREAGIFFRALTRSLGFRQVDVPFEVQARSHGSQSWSNLNLFRYALNALLMFSSVPLYVILALGVIVLLLSTAIGVKLAILMIIHSQVPAGYATVIYLLLLTLSVNMISLGIIGLYVSKVLEQVKNRPRYLILDRLARRDAKPTV